MEEDFNPERFIQLLEEDFKQYNSQKIRNIFVLIKGFFEDVYHNSDYSRKDKRKGFENKLLHVEYELDKVEKDFKRKLSQQSYCELKKFIYSIKERHNLDPIFGIFSGVSDARFLSEKTLKLLKTLQPKFLPRTKLFYAID